MPNDEKQSSTSSSSRHRAKEMIGPLPDHGSRTNSDTSEPIRGFKVHETRREIENDVQGEISAAHCECEDLYEFAPCGYVTLNQKGLVTRSNVTAGRLLGVDKTRIKDVEFNSFVAPESRDDFRATLKRAWENGEQQSVELKLNGAGKGTLRVIAAIQAYRVAEGEVAQWRLVLVGIPERKRAEDDAGDQVETLTRVFEKVPFIMMLVDKDVRVKKINRKGTAFVGRPGEQLLGLLGGEVLHCLNSFHGPGCGKNPECGSCPIRTRVTQTFKTGEGIYDAEARMTVRKGSQNITVEMSISTALVKDKDVDHVLVTVADITERKRAEEALRESEERFRQIAGLIPQVFWMTDSGLKRMLYVSPAYEKIWGRTCESLYENPHSWIEAVHPADLETVKEALSLRKTQGHSIEYRIIRPDGKIRWIRDFGFAIYDAGGNPCRSAGIAEDITERKHAKDAVMQSEENYRRLFEAVSDAILVLDGETREFMDVNASALRLYGYSREEFLKLQQSDIADVSDKSDASIEEVLQGVRTQMPLRYHRKKDGTEFPVEISTSAFVFEGRKVACGVVRDITERARHTMEIKRLNRLYSVLSRVSQEVVRAKSPEVFLRQACREIVEGGGFLLSWIGLVDPTTNAVVPTALWGEIGEYVHGITVYADDRPEGRGPVGTCIREQRPAVHNDFLHDQRTLPWRDRAAPFGIASVAAFRIERAGRVWGALAIYSDEVDRFGEEDVKLLEKVAGDIGFALENLDREVRRERAEESLRESEERFRAVFEAASVGMAQADVDTGRWERVNAKLCEITGYSAEELIGMRFTEITHPDDRQPDWEAFREVVSGKARHYQREKRYVRKDGTIVWVNANVTLVTKVGRRTVSIAVIEDISRRKQAEDALRESESKLRTLFETVAEGIALHEMVYDQNGAAVDYRILSTNAAFEKLTGLVAAKTHGQPASIIYGTGTAPYLDEYAQVAETCRRPVSRPSLLLLRNTSTFPSPHLNGATS